jgi:integrase
MARDVGLEPTRPFDHRLSRVAQNWGKGTELGTNSNSKHNTGLLITKAQIDYLNSFDVSNFKTFCEIDLQLDVETAKQHRAKINAFLAWLKNRELSQSTIREYLTLYTTKSPCTYANRLKSLKVFCRDYLRAPQLVETFKFPNIPFQPKDFKTKMELRKFYAALEGLKDKALFLVYASSGLRRQEALQLHREDIDLEKFIIKPKPHRGRTKHSWFTFFNAECAEMLKQYLATRTDSNPKLFPMSRAVEEKLWHFTIEKSGIRITPQMLRDWFCDEMGNRGMADRYIDALCGRIPKKVLARHYSDFAPAKMWKRYRKAKIKILS